MADDSRRRVRRRRPGAPKPADPAEARRSTPGSAAESERKAPAEHERAAAEPAEHERAAAKPDRKPPAKPDRKPPAESRPERSLRGLVGPGPTQVGVSAAMRARDAARPGPQDIAAAERDLTIVRRHYRPEDAAPRRNRRR